MPKAFHNQTVPGQQEHDAALQLMYAGFGILCVIIGVLMWDFGFRRPQIFEIYLVLLLIFYLGIMDPIKRMMKRKKELEKLWPKPRLLVSEDRDRQCMETAAKQNSTFLGYEDDGTPVYWTDDQRAMQTNVPGVSGAGKSTLLLNVLEQDIRRGKAVIFLDGKGEKEFITKLWATAIASGRGDDVRLIDPSHPEISNRYNPFYAPGGGLGRRVGIVFDSLGAAQSKEEFFVEHQRAFLDSISNILSYTGKTLTFQAILAASPRPDTIRETILSVRNRVLSDPNLKQHVKDAFEMDAALLEGIYNENDWLTKVRGLLNSMKPFVGEALAEITGATDNLVTIEEVIEKNLILLVSINIGGDSQPNKSLGRIILRDVQAQIAKRYDDYKLSKKHSFISIVLDEFGLFAYGGFSNIIHTARQANASFIFSFQSVKQLAGCVGPSFADDVSTATNCKFVMRTSDEDTARIFMSASGSYPTHRLSYQVERPMHFEGLAYEDTGRGSRQEVYETRVKDFQLKDLPTGQMMALLPDRRMGVIVKHIYVRRPIEYYLHDALTPPWLLEYGLPEKHKNKVQISFQIDDANRNGRKGRRTRKS